MKISKGFSLLEVLVIIAIIGIVSTYGISSFTNTASDTEFRKGDILTENFIEEIKNKAFTDNKPYKIYLENNADSIEMKVYAPNGTAWFDPSLTRMCDCHVGINSGHSICSNVFLDSISGQTPSATKIINGLNVKKCNNENCSTESSAVIELCLLSNGSAARTNYFKLKDTNSNNSKVKKFYKTGYVE